MMMLKYYLYMSNISMVMLMNPMCRCWWTAYKCSMVMSIGWCCATYLMLILLTCLSSICGVDVWRLFLCKDLAATLLVATQWLLGRPVRSGSVWLNCGEKLPGSVLTVASLACSHHCSHPTPATNIFGQFHNYPNIFISLAGLKYFHPVSEWGSQLF